MKTFVSVNRRLVGAIRTIMPIAHLRFSGVDSPENKYKDYAIFNIPVRKATMLQSGKNEKVRVYGYIDVFTVDDPSTSTSVLEEIDEALSNAGFNVINIATISHIDELGRYHSEIEWSIKEDVDGG